MCVNIYMFTRLHISVYGYYIRIVHAWTFYFEWRKYVPIKLFPYLSGQKYALIMHIQYSMIRSGMGSGELIFWKQNYTKSWLFLAITDHNDSDLDWSTHSMIGALLFWLLDIDLVNGAEMIMEQNWCPPTLHHSGHRSVQIGAPVLETWLSHQHGRYSSTFPYFFTPSPHLHDVHVLRLWLHAGWVLGSYNILTRSITCPGTVLLKSDLLSWCYWHGVNLCIKLLKSACMTSFTTNMDHIL